jgi:hypothetical protein
VTRMFPASKPPGITFSEGEVFDLIREAPGLEDYFCLHSLGLARHARKEYTETDFVLVGPGGVYCLEVKGGKVERKNGEWTIGSAEKSYTSREGPFKQAEGARWTLTKELDARLGTDLRKSTITGWGVIFPSTVFEEKSPEWDLQVVYDQRDKAHSFSKYVERLEHYFRDRAQGVGRAQPPRLGPAKVREIVDCLRHDFDVVPTTKGLIAETHRELVALSPDQYRVLDFALHEGNPHIICDGTAGTGKTIIALEAARRLAEQGLKVLLLCFNDNLAAFLRRSIGQTKATVHVSAVYRFLSEVIHVGGYGSELKAAQAALPQKQLFLEAYPRIFDDAAAALMSKEKLEQFDAVVADEGQDILHTPIMNCLDLVLKGGFSKGRWAIFLDTGLQSDVYGRLNDQVLNHLRSLQAVTLVLRENFRNPKNIVSEMSALIAAPAPICKRQEGLPVDYRIYEDEKSQAKKLRALLVELLREGVAPNQIAILSARKREDSCAIRFPPDVGKPLHYLDGAGMCPNDSIIASSLSAFKGLESEVVILTDLPELSPISDWAKSIIYVGMTRARTRLFALVTRSFLDARYSAVAAPQ